MSLLDKVLKGIDDLQPIANRLSKSPALKLLVDTYIKETENDATLPVLTGMTVGRELKDSIALLDCTVQINMLKKYSDVVHGVLPEETAAERDKRRLRYWFLKFGVWSCLVLAGVVAATIYKSGVMPDNHFISSFLTKTTEIVRFVFSPGPAPVK